jgi:hypothetical protein
MKQIDHSLAHAAPNSLTHKLNWRTGDAVTLLTSCTRLGPPRKCRLRNRVCGSILLELPMPTFLLSPLVKWSLAALGGAMVVHWAIKEARRINEELEQARRVKAKITDGENRPTLRRDPVTGEYRL